MAQERHCARLDYNFGSIVGQVVLDVLNDALMNEGYNLALDSQLMGQQLVGAEVLELHVVFDFLVGIVLPICLRIEIHFSKRIIQCGST